MERFLDGLNPDVSWGCNGTGDRRPRVAIGMMSSPGIPSYAHSAEAVNLAYAQKHGYDFVVERCPERVDCDWKWSDDDQYRFVWFKARFIAKHLPNYHVFVFVDSDAYFLDRERPLLDFVREEIRDDRVVLMMAEDCETDGVCWKAGKPNTGVVVAINRPGGQSYDLLQTWIDAAEKEDGRCVKWRRTHPREQACISDLADRDPAVSDRVQILSPGSKMGQRDGNFIRHLVGMKTDRRTAILSAESTKTATNLTGPVGSVTALWSICAVLFLVVLVLSGALYMSTKRGHTPRATSPPSPPAKQ